MNIAYYTHYFMPEIGAPSARVYDMARQWLKQGHQTKVVTCFPNHPTGKVYPDYRLGLRQKEILDGITVHRHLTYVTPNSGFLKKTIGHISFLPAALFLSTPWMGRTDVVIGTSPTFFAAMAAASAGVFWRVPFVMEVRDLWPAAVAELGVIRNRVVLDLLERLELSLYRQAKLVITVTRSFRENIISRGIPAEKVHTITNGADVEFWNVPDKGESATALRHRLGLDGRFVVLYIGAHGISQGLGSIIQSAQQLQDDDHIQFVFVGEGAEKNQLIKQAEQARLTNIQFLDPVDKPLVRDFYTMADVCLVPLRNVPLLQTFIPSKMFEILAMARPVVASVAGEAADILKQSGAAMVVPPGDSVAIASSVRQLAANPDVARTMGVQGRQFVIEHYSRSSLAMRYEALLEGIVSPAFAVQGRKYQ
jgi:glycosyltransferase involved in cell wall biosynthesis